jgi:hypothetical protein
MRAADIMTTNVFTIDSLATVADAISRSKNALRSSDQSPSKAVHPLPKQRLAQVDTKEWKAFISALELVNHFIDEAMADMKLVKEVQDSAAKLILVASKIAAM